MASVNKVILVGNLGRDPEIRYMPSGDAVANFSIATTDKWKDKTSGEMKEATEWHRISMFGRNAEVAGEYLKKGSQVYIEGKLQTRKWTDKEGHERTTTEVKADMMQMLGGRQGMGGANMDDDHGASPPTAGARSAARSTATSAASAPAAKKPSSGFDDMDDDIPF